MIKILRGSLEIHGYNCNLYGTTPNGFDMFIHVLGPDFDVQYNDETGEYIQAMPDINQECENDPDYEEAYGFELVDYDPSVFAEVKEENWNPIIHNAVWLATNASIDQQKYNLDEIFAFLKTGKAAEDVPWYADRFTIMRFATNQARMYRKWG